MSERKNLQKQKYRLMKKKDFDVEKIKQINIELARTKPTKKRFKKQVIQFDKMGNIIHRFDYLERVRDHGFVPQCVKSVCEKINKTHKGYRWEYGMEQLVECG